jgi:hypothetical protein
LDELFEVFKQAKPVLNHFLADTNVTYERNIESSNKYNQKIMQHMEDVAYDTDTEFVLDKVDFILVEIIIVTLGITLGILLLSILLVSSINFILYSDGFKLLLVQ